LFAELSDIPHGPCLGFYVLSKEERRNQRIRRREERRERRARRHHQRQQQHRQLRRRRQRQLPPPPPQRQLNNSSNNDDDDDDDDCDDDDDDDIGNTAAAAAAATSKRRRTQQPPEMSEKPPVVRARDQQYEGRQLYDPATRTFNLQNVLASVTSGKPLLVTKASRPSIPGVLAGVAAMKKAGFDFVGAAVADGCLKRKRGRPTKADAAADASTAFKYAVRKEAAERSVKTKRTLVPETRYKNVTDREEGVVIQYLALGGYRWFMCSSHNNDNNDDDDATDGGLCPIRTLRRIGSALHSGAGQQTFGWDKGQRADLLLNFVNARTGASVLHYHNHHEAGAHYTGHTSSCWRGGNTSRQSATAAAAAHRQRAGAASEHNAWVAADEFLEPANEEGEEEDEENVDTLNMNTATRRSDHFKSGLAKALTAVRPDRCRFVYSVTTSCDMFHGSDRRPAVPPTALKSGNRSWYATATDACLADHEREFFYVPPGERRRPLDIDGEVLPGILNGTITGFVTVRGGRETMGHTTGGAGHRFGFCVQRYAPTPKQVSPFTKRQIAQYMQLGPSVATDDDDDDEDDDNNGEEGRYHPYANKEDALRARDEKVEAFIKQQDARTLNSGTFHTWETLTTSYLKWLMQKRGFVDFEISHLLVYRFTDDPRHFLEPILQRRHEAKLAGRVVEAECLKLVGNGSFGYNGLEITNYTRVRLLRHSAYREARYKGLAHEMLKHTTLLAAVRHRLQPAKKKKKKTMTKKKKKRTERSAFVSDEAQEEGGDDDDDDDDDEDDDNDDDVDNDNNVFDEDAERDAVLGLNVVDNDDGGDGGRQRQSGRTSCAKLYAAAAAVEGWTDDSVAEQDAILFGDDPSRIGVSPLYAVDVSGENRRLFNNVAKAVAVLGNSKRVFFNHLLAMMNCLDPRLAELCYIDTDSCLWSLTYENLDMCLLPEKEREWRRLAVLADETGPHSCHGKMKLEGTYRAALFKTAKIYRLFGRCATTADVYTRCKGVNRYQACQLGNYHFDVDWNRPAVVHRTGLRPTRTGEVVIASEAKRLSVPFNLKRYVTKDGIHTLPFSAVEVSSSSSSSSSSGLSDDDKDDVDDDRDKDDDIDRVVAVETLRDFVVVDGGDGGGGGGSDGNAENNDIDESGDDNDTVAQLPVYGLDDESEDDDSE